LWPWHFLERLDEIVPDAGLMPDNTRAARLGQTVVAGLMASGVTFR
jgi:hypothetical protein